AERERAVITLRYGLGDAPGEGRPLGYFEAARCLYNTLLGEALARLDRMRADPAQAGRRVPCQRRRNRNGRRPSPNSDKRTGSPSMPCMISLSGPTARGLLTTSMRSPRKRWQPAPDLGGQSGVPRESQKGALQEQGARTL